MNITDYSFLSAVICFDIFILIGRLLQRQLHLFLGYNFFPVLLMTALSLIRIAAPIEFEYVRVVRDYTVLPAIQAVLQTQAGAFTTASILTGAVAAGSTIMFIRLMLLMRRERNTLKSYPLITDERVLCIMDQVVQNEKRGFEIRMADAKISCFIWSLGKPAVVVPSVIFERTDKEIFHILTHEWQHYAEKDAWYKLFIRILCCVMWWNPVVFILQKDMNQTFELRCDLNATKKMMPEDREEYINTLLWMGTVVCEGEIQRRGAHVLSLPFAGIVARTCGKRAGHQEYKNVKRNLLQRYGLIDQYHKRNRMIGACSMAFAALLFVVSFQFVVQPYVMPPSEDLREIQEKESEDVDSIFFYETTKENAYIINNQDGIYSLYINDRHIRDLSPDEVTKEPHNTLPVIVQKEK